MSTRHWHVVTLVLQEGRFHARFYQPRVPLKSGAESEARLRRAHLSKARNKVRTIRCDQNCLELQN